MQWGSVRITPEECKSLHVKPIYYPERFKTQHYELNPDGVTYFWHDLVGTIDFDGKCSGQGNLRDPKFSLYIFEDYIISDYYSGN